jgi:hypothetical protein
MMNGGSNIDATSGKGQPTNVMVEVELPSEHPPAICPSASTRKPSMRPAAASRKPSMRPCAAAAAPEVIDVEVVLEEEEAEVVLPSRPAASARKPSMRPPASARNPSMQPSASSAPASSSLQLAGASVPVLGQLYHVKLCSSHYGAVAGGFLDAHRALKKDQCSADATFASVHNAAFAGAAPLPGNGGQWVVEALPDEALGALPILYRSTSFRLKLATGHAGCPAGLYLSGVHPATAATASRDAAATGSGAGAEAAIKRGDVKQSVRASFSALSAVLPPGLTHLPSSLSSSHSVTRSKDSTWCVVQPLESCATTCASSVWTLVPAVGGSSSLSSSSSRTSPGEQQFVLASVHAAASGSLMPPGSSPLCFLDVHGSDKKDTRSEHSSFVNCHAELPGASDCKGLWSFHAVAADASSLAASTFGGLGPGQQPTPAAGNDGGGGVCGVAPEVAEVRALVNNPPMQK